MDEEYEAMKFSNIKAGSRLRYAGFETTPSVEILHVMLPGHVDYDGGLPGISFRWLKNRRGKWFYPCKSLGEFFSDFRFSNLEVCL